MGVTSGQLPAFAAVTLILCLVGLCMSKPLNALLAGDKYAESLGYDPRRIRTEILFYSGALTAVATAYCGPVGFIGSLPSRISHAWRSAPPTIQCFCRPQCSQEERWGCCARCCACPGATKAVLPLGPVTPVIGIPVILYVIIRRKRLYYFN